MNTHIMVFEQRDGEYEKWVCTECGRSIIINNTGAGAKIVRVLLQGHCLIPHVLLEESMYVDTITMSTVQIEDDEDGTC